MSKEEWQQWIPKGGYLTRRPVGCVAIYKKSEHLKIFEASFEEFKDGPGFINVNDLYKFATIYSRTLKGDTCARYLGFKLWRCNPGVGALQLRTEAPNGYVVSLKPVLDDLGYKFANKTMYFKLFYNVLRKMHYIAIAGPAFFVKDYRTFVPIPMEKEKDA